MKKLLLITLPVVLLLFAACTSIISSGNYIKENREFSGFSEINVSSAIELFLTQDDVESVEIKTSDNIMQYIETKMTGNTLHIRVKPKISISTGHVYAYVSVKTLKKLTASGASVVKLENTISGDELVADISGASLLKGMINYDSAKFNLSGASTTDLSGFVSDLDLICSGASKAKDFTLSVDDLTVNLSGASEAKITVNNNLSYNLSGASDLRYKGNPIVLSASSTGASTVKSNI